MQTNREFQKYALRGAYHWDMISRNPRKHHPFVAARYHLCLEMLEPVKGLKVLDLGCGDGALAGLLAKAGANVTGVDPNAIGLKLAQQSFTSHRLSGEFLQSTAELPDGHFDCVVCSEVIEHVPEPAVMLLEIERLLRPAGTAIISTPIRLTETVRDVEHRCEYYPSEFERLCSEYFSVVEIRHALPVGLQEILYISGWKGRLLGLLLRVLSAWANWNYMLNLKGSYSLYEVQFARVARKSGK